MEFSVNQRAKQYSKCCFTNCKSHILSKDSLSFFTFPKEPARCAVWIENCKNDQLKTIKNLAVNTKYRLCQHVFVKTCQLQNAMNKDDTEEDFIILSSFLCLVVVWLYRGYD